MTMALQPTLNWSTRTRSPTPHVGGHKQRLGRCLSFRARPGPGGCMGQVQRPVDEAGRWLPLREHPSGPGPRRCFSSRQTRAESIPSRSPSAEVNTLSKHTCERCGALIRRRYATPAGWCCRSCDLEQMLAYFRAAATYGENLSAARQMSPGTPSAASDKNSTAPTSPPRRHAPS